LRSTEREGVTVASPRLRAAVAAAYRRAFRPPFEIPLALVGNAVLMTAAWFLVPPRVHDWLFSLHGPLAFPVVMASWMLGDTPSTNVAGLDTDTALAVLDEPRAFRIWLGARSIVLTSLVGIPCAIIALIIGFQGQPMVKVVLACVVIAVLPFGILPISAWLGLLLPYHLRPLRWRWDHRADWRRIVRWLVLLMAPFGVVPVVAAMIVGPSLALARLGFGAPEVPLSQPKFVLVALTICGSALLFGWIGLWGAGRLRQWRHNHLTRYLQDPAAG
jgi:hypothetical protein